MAANYWESTQRRYWQFTRQQLEQLRKDVADEDSNLVQMYPLPEIRHLSIFFNQRTLLQKYVSDTYTNRCLAELVRLGKRIGARQQPIATAQLYLRRFYCKVEIRRTNPYLMVATALYLACKMEECPHHIRLVVSEGRSLWPDYFSGDVSSVGEAEFSLISEMSSQMIVHHPYRTLISLQGYFSLTQDESTFAWSIINDHYMTDLPLFFAPHTIAIMAVLLALVLRPTNSGAAPSSALAASISSSAQDALTSAMQLKSGCEKQTGILRSKTQKLACWLAESNIDIDHLVDCTQEVISFYSFYEQYNEKLTKEQINRFIKARGLDK
ncbi:RNA polymerase II holoenzyme cyclin-like subunit [Podosphaera aphanis]|nr:RNA polymerase II holoenzyme cyclin-like subunit [Podosphaera aphanis]